MRTTIILLMTYMLGVGGLVSYSDMNCDETVEILKQRITVQQMTNNIQKEMIQKRDSIIYAQDSIIVKLQSR